MATHRLREITRSPDTIRIGKSGFRFDIFLCLAMADSVTRDREISTRNELTSLNPRRNFTIRSNCLRFKRKVNLRSSSSDSVSSLKVYHFFETRLRFLCSQDRIAFAHLSFAFPRVRLKDIVKN